MPSRTTCLFKGKQYCRSIRQRHGNTDICFWFVSSPRLKRNRCSSIVKSSLIMQSYHTPYLLGSNLAGIKGA